MTAVKLDAGAVPTSGIPVTGNAVSRSERSKRASMPTRMCRATLRGMSRLLATAVLLSSVCVFAQQKATLCELITDPLRFAGQTVEVRATLTGNFEMSLLIDDSCPRSNVLIWYGRGMVATDTSQYALIDSMDALKKSEGIVWHSPAPVVFHATKDSKKMADYMAKYVKKFGEVSVTATFTGRFDYIPKWLALKAPDGKLTAVSAFGHQLCCSARLEPQTVTDVVVPKK
jgi:hypothetical protein